MKKIVFAFVFLCVVLSVQSGKAAHFFGLGQYATELYPQFAHDTSADGSIVVGDADLGPFADEAVLLAGQRPGAAQRRGTGRDSLQRGDDPGRRSARKGPTRPRDAG